LRVLLGGVIGRYILAGIGVVIPRMIGLFQACSLGVPEKRNRRCRERRAGVRKRPDFISFWTGFSDFGLDLELEME
jgi:hypothetical protein